VSGDRSGRAGRGGPGADGSGADGSGGGPSAGRVRVLIVDDQAMVRAGLRMIVDHEDDLEVVGEAADGAAALPMCRALDPDVVLMDVRMPRMDGLVATREILGAPRPAGRRRPGVLVLTTFDDEEYLLESLRAGASGFLLKDVAPDVMVAGIRTVHRGESLVDPAMTGVLVARCLELEQQRPQPGSAVARTWDGMADLSPREVDVLRDLARGASNRELARSLGLTEATIKSHVSSVLAKLGARSRLEAVVAAYESGLVAPGRPPTPTG
jgi:DNA-binding NarL/FixJ family response regulator